MVGEKAAEEPFLLNIVGINDTSSDLLAGGNIHLLRYNDIVQLINVFR